MDTYARRSAKSAIRRCGLIAQEVEEAVETHGVDFSGVYHPQNESDLYGLQYAELTIPLIKAVQQLSEEINTLQRELERQRQIVGDQAKQLATLRSETHQ